MDTPLQEKERKLHNILKSYGRLAIAFSGGVDSVLLLQEAAETLGKDNVLAITVRADNFPQHEFQEAESFALSQKIHFTPLPWDPFTVPEFTANNSDRCYHCKKALYSLILEEAVKSGFPVLADGANASDADDYRPGAQAAKELGIVSPLAQAELAKNEIRLLLQESHNTFWSKPAIACLATRIPTGIPVSRDALKMIDNAESALRSLGFSNIRVRHHGDVARIEVEPGERRKFVDADLWEQADTLIKAAGYRYAALDLCGYKRGNMNA